VATLFQRIINSELPGHFAYKDSRCVVFMTIAPITTGHALVVPREPYDHWIDVPADLNAHLFGVARLVGLAQRAAFRASRIGLVVAGFEVNHCHLHCIPADTMTDLDFSRQQRGTPAEALAGAAVALAAQLRADGVAGAVVS
jgi:histidine triad (HIT) family protein